MSLNRRLTLPLTLDRRGQGTTEEIPGGAVSLAQLRALRALRAHMGQERTGRRASRRALEDGLRRALEGS